jgi:hypothetical protein
MVGRKMFFSEEKNQKTVVFSSVATCLAMARKVATPQE